MKLIRDLLLIVVFMSLLQTFMQQDMRSGEIPDMSVKTIGGENSATLLLNKPAIIYFWGSWCGICTTIQGTISAVLRDYPGITVALRSGSNTQLQHYLKKNKLDWPVVNDDDGDLAQQFGVSAVPAVFIIGPDGKIGFVTRGYVTEIGLRLRLWWLAYGF